MVNVMDVSWRLLRILNSIEKLHKQLVREFKDAEGNTAG